MNTTPNQKKYGIRHFVIGLTIVVGFLYFWGASLNSPTSGGMASTQTTRYVPDEVDLHVQAQQNEVALLNQKLLRKDEVKASAEHFKHLFDELKTKIESATYEQRSDVIHLLVSSIHVYKHRELAEVRMNVPITSHFASKSEQSINQTKEILCPPRLY